MRNICTGLALLLLGGPLAAQHPLVTGHDFEREVTVPAEADSLPDAAVVLKRYRVVDHEEENGEIIEYYLAHSTILLKDAKAIEENNKVYVSLNRALDMPKVRARSISPDGQVIELDQKAFKQASDEDGRGNQLYFAFDGLVPGSVIDYFYMMKKRSQPRGDYMALQTSAPILWQEFHLTHPDRFIYRTKSYQGAPEATFDTTMPGMTHRVFTQENVPALLGEPYSNVEAMRMGVVFFLDAVPDIGIKDHSGYVGATKLYHSALSTPVDKRTKKELQALIKKMRLSFSRDEEDKVRTLEDHLKTGYAILESDDPRLSDLNEIMKNKACNQVGMFRLTCALLLEIGVNYEVVVTTDRTRIPFDPDLECYLFLQDILLYLPSLGKYMAPDHEELRLGYAAQENMGNHGLFIKHYDLGGTSVGVGEVRYIEALPDTATKHDLALTVLLDPDDGSSEIIFSAGTMGYYGILQSYWELIPEDRQKELIEEQVEYLLENGEYETPKVKNGEGRFFGVKPFTIEGRVKTRKFNGTAGNKLTFKVGELIGPQMEMYQEKERQLPVETDFNRSYGRTIVITIPKGWSVQNLGDLVIEKHVDLDGKRVFAFDSRYTLDGGTLTVSVDEYYRSLHAPADRFGDYRAVINAAADFNKVVLVLAKD